MYFRVVEYLRYICISKSPHLESLVFLLFVLFVSFDPELWKCEWHFLYCSHTSSSTAFIIINFTTMLFFKLRFLTIIIRSDICERTLNLDKARYYGEHAMVLCGCTRPRWLWWLLSTALHPHIPTATSTWQPRRHDLQVHKAHVDSCLHKKALNIAHSVSISSASTRMREKSLWKWEMSPSLVSKTYGSRSDSMTPSVAKGVLVPPYACAWCVSESTTRISLGFRSGRLFSPEICVKVSQQNYGVSVDTLSRMPPTDSSTSTSMSEAMVHTLHGLSHWSWVSQGLDSKWN